MKKLLYSLINLILIFILIFGGFLLYTVIKDYKPEEIVSLTVENNQDSILKTDTPFQVLTYNIGGGTLDQKADFFMDGGTMSRASSKEQVLTNIQNITSFIKGYANMDTIGSIVMLQEVDVDSSRSYYINQLNYLQQELKNFSSTFAYNHKVDWIPVPVLHPLGRARSGLAVFSEYAVDESKRYDLPGKEDWLTQLFELDRCFIESRLKVENGKDLVLINLHLSAFDEGGKIRVQQLEYLKQHLLKEYESGNYIIVGGDWNHELPDTDLHSVKMTEEKPFWLQTLPVDFTPQGFHWVTDPFTPTVRTVAKAYEKDVNFLSIIDGFLVSDNVKVHDVRTENLGFDYSDHNPVSAMFTLENKP